MTAAPHPILAAVPEGGFTPDAVRLATGYLTELGLDRVPDAPAPHRSAASDAPASDSPAASDAAPDSAGTAGAAAESVRRFTRERGPMRLLSVFYAVMVSISVYGQTDGIIRWRHLHQLTLLGGLVHIPARGLALIPAATLELLAAVLFTFADWRRSVKLERALAVRALAVLVAAGVAALNYMAHDDLFDQAVFVGVSAFAFAIVVAHTGARRRDAHPDQVKPSGPEYGLVQWLAEPRVTVRARQLALAVPDHLVKASPQATRAGSLALARQQLDAEAQTRLAEQQARQQAERITDALGLVIDKSVDPVTARLALASFDLSDIARRVAAAVDNAGMAALLVADLTPAQLTAQAPDEARKASTGRRRRATESAAPDAGRAASTAESATESAGESDAPAASDAPRQVNRDAGRTSSPRRTRRTDAPASAARTAPDSVAALNRPAPDAPAPAAPASGESAGTVTRLNPEANRQLGEELRGWVHRQFTTTGGLPSQRAAMRELQARGHRVGLKRAGKVVEIAHKLGPDAREATA